MKYLILFLIASGSAQAKDFSVNDGDQAAIQVLCDTASLSPNVSREARAQISGWCVAWEQRVKAAAKPEAKTEELPEGLNPEPKAKPHK